MPLQTFSSVMLYVAENAFLKHVLCTLYYVINRTLYKLKKPLIS